MNAQTTPAMTGIRKDEFVFGVMVMRFWRTQDFGTGVPNYYSLGPQENSLILPFSSVQKNLSHLSIFVR